MKRNNFLIRTLTLIWSFVGSVTLGGVISACYSRTLGSIIGAVNFLIFIVIYFILLHKST